MKEDDVKRYALIDFSGKIVMRFVNKDYAVRYMKDSNSLLYTWYKDAKSMPRFFYILKEKEYVS